MPRIVYSHHYNIGFYGLERLHPFDSRKYGRAWKLLQKQLDSSLNPMWLRPSRPASWAELKLVHSEAYLQSLRDSGSVAQALELPPLSHVPPWLIDWHVLRPMRWATRGSILAAQAALDHGLAVNLSGGYHHAKPDQGEGFCIYSDIGIAIASLRADRLIADDAQIVYIDTDAHQGNGVCQIFANDPRCLLFDIYNTHIYPSHELGARDRLDCDVPLDSGCGDEEYLAALTTRLPRFLESANESTIGLAIYNAGTDVFAGDPLGGFNVSAAAILNRDLFVVDQLRQRSIPTVMLLSGGYTPVSYQLVAKSVGRLLQI